MSRVCDVTGKKPMFGNNVSHANNKSRRRFNINLQKKKFWLPDEKRYVTLRLSTRGMRIIDKKGIRRVVNELRAKGILYNKSLPDMEGFFILKRPRKKRGRFHLSTFSD